MQMDKLKLTSQLKRLIIDVNGIKIGENLIVIAGPCSVENEKQIVETAIAVKQAGAHLLRGGAFKPRTSPYAFQGLGEEGLKYLQQAEVGPYCHMIQ